MIVRYRAIDTAGVLIDCVGAVCCVIRESDGQWMQADGRFLAQPAGRYFFTLVDSSDGVTFTVTLPDVLESGVLYRIACSSDDALEQVAVVDGADQQATLISTKPRKVNEVLVAVERETRTADGAGGYITTKAAISGSPFIARLLRRQSRTFTEGAQAEPGFIVAPDRVLVFEPASVDIRVQDICTVDSISYRVVSLRKYARTLQSDLEAAV